MNVSVIISFVISAYFLVDGLCMLLAGKSISGSSYYKKYTESSVKKFMKPAGIANLFIAVAFFAVDANMHNDDLFKLENTTFLWVITGVAAAIAIVFYVIGSKNLVKIGDKNAKGEEDEVFVDED